jgi:protease-4
LSGQPDIVAGLTPEVDAILQASVTDTYSDFLSRVAEARGKTVADVDTIAQGRVWDGGTARQLGLVDQFGGIEDALGWVAGEAEIEEGEWKARYLGAAQANYDSLIRQLVVSAIAPVPAASTQSSGGDLFALAARQREVVLGQVLRDAQLLAGTRGVQAYCLECPTEARPLTASESSTLMQLFGGWFAR